MQKKSEVQVKLVSKITDFVIDRGILPDFMLRASIKNILRIRIIQEKHGGPKKIKSRKQQLIQKLRSSPVAVNTNEANKQHYEFPTEFFKLMLGPNLKYSSGLWAKKTKSLSDAESEMLKLTCRRAGLVDGQDILELGCGWGSLTIWMARNFPNSKIVAISNSSTQRKKILNRAKAEGVSNIKVYTFNIGNITDVKKADKIFRPNSFDRVVSVEMFEHIRNYQQVMEKVGLSLRPGGKLFVHIFVNREVAYTFGINGRDDWMARHFFTGGLMASQDLLLSFDENLSIEKTWVVNGKNYSKTAEAWLENMDKNKQEIMKILTRSTSNPIAYWRRWRVFNMACAELFGYNNGEEWYVCHYLFSKKHTN